MTEPEPTDVSARYDFELDRFQREAIAALAEGRHVVVAAPTGSGKTVVAEDAIERALRRGRRSMYTAPVKALSNQKYRDLVDLHGARHVGLLTGDNSINGDAAVVVMTTEVLRNMIYAGRHLDDLDVVVLDEVHFLQDAYRGPVWEEVIIHLPEHVQLVCLSATVSNAADLGEWIETVRGPTTVVVEERRPVELRQHYLLTDRTTGMTRLLPTFVDGEPNGEALRLDASTAGPSRRRERPRPPTRRRLATPNRLDTLDVLIGGDLLPAIHFVFSRVGCDAAAAEATAAGFRLIGDDDRRAVRELADRRVDGFARSDLDVLGYDQFTAQLDAGIAAHHAGMVPPFKEIVEAAFLAGLVRCVYATETLAVGINMPARTVVLDRLTKYTGEHHAILSPAQFTQLTGRAGRRGIDERGNAVVLWSPFVRFEQVVELASSRSFHLRSAFRPTYNMAVNLVATYPRGVARRLLTLSFAQFQADRDVVRLERRLGRLRERLSESEAVAASPFGDVEEYRREVLDAAGPVEVALERLRPGDVIHFSRGKHHGPVAVVATAHRQAGLRLTVVTPSGHASRATAADFDVPPTPQGSIVLPGRYSPNDRRYRDEVGRRIKQAELSRRTVAARDVDAPSRSVEADPELDRRVRAARRAERTRAEIADLEARIDRRSATLAVEFDGVLAVLAARGVVDVEGWTVSSAGEMVRRVFHESDLLVAECVRAGWFDGLDDASVAALASTFVYEHRSPDDPPPPSFPSTELRARWRSVEGMSDELAALERLHDVPEHRRPDPTFVPIAHAWVDGGAFSALVDDDDLTGGDFVRTIKQLIDLLRQIAIVAEDPLTRAAARRAADTAQRGVVADSNVVGEPQSDEEPAEVSGEVSGGGADDADPSR